MPKLGALIDGFVDLISIIMWPIVALAGSLQNILVQNRYIGAFLAITIFSLSTSGVIYNLQHDMEWSGYDGRNKKHIYIHPQSRSQFLGEGLWFSFLNTSFCLLASLSLYIPFWLEKQKIATALNNPYIARIVSGACLICSYLAWRTVRIKCSSVNKIT